MALQEQLLPTSDAAVDVGLVESRLATGPSYSGGSGAPQLPQVKILEGRCRDYMMSALLLVAIAVPSITVIGVVATQWQSSPSQRGWLILGFGFYIAAGFRHCWSLLVQLCGQILYLRVEVRRYAASTLFDAITDAVASEAERDGRTCSFDQEAVQEHDSLTGKFSVKLKFWSSQARTVKVAIRIPSEQQQRSREQLHVQVQFQPGEDVVVGRDSRLERREILVLSVLTSPSRVREDKELLLQWMDGSYSNFVKPSEEFVDVYALQQSSIDWVPEWKHEKTKPCKHEESTGQSFFLARASMQKVLADARLWPTTTLRVYIITGPPGVGKSEFTLWMAGQLGLPIYRLSLTSSQLTDERLAQLLSQTSVKLNSVLVQVDEFQETLERWAEGKAVGVSPGGFCEVLQGSTARGEGVVILTGTPEIISDKMKAKFPAVYRRIDETGELTWMSQDDISKYFRKFLERFVPKMSHEKWMEKQNQFLHCPAGQQARTSRLTC